MNKSKWLFIAGIVSSIGVVEYRRYMSFLDTLSTTVRGLKIKKDGKSLNISFADSIEECIEFFKGITDYELNPS